MLYNTNDMRKQSGFTVIELIVAILVLVGAATIVLIQKNDLNAQHRDVQRKTAINAIYYNLEEVAYPVLGGYPAVLSPEQLKAMDQALLTDPSGIKIGESGSNYSYEPSSCTGTVCKHYTLYTTLEHEATFEKRSKN